MRFSPTLITAVLFLISPYSQSGFRQSWGGWRIDSVHCIARGKWRTSLPVVSLHLPSLPLISTPQQLASHLVTGKWYSAGRVFGRKWQGTWPGAAGVVPQIVMLKAKQDTWLKSARASGSHIRLTVPEKYIVTFFWITQRSHILVLVNHWLCEEAGSSKILCSDGTGLQLLYSNIQENARHSLVAYNPKN